MRQKKTIVRYCKNKPFKYGNSWNHTVVAYDRKHPEASLEYMGMESDLSFMPTPFQQLQP